VKYKFNKKLNPLVDHLPKSILKSSIYLVLLLVVATAGIAIRLVGNSTKADYISPTINIISPQANADVATNSTFTVSANLSNTPSGSYNMFWYIDNGTWNWMGDNGQGNKQATINVSNWTWHSPSTSYTIDVVAVMNSNGQRYYNSTTINIGASTTKPSMSMTTSNTPTTTTTAAATPSSLYADPASNAAQTASSTSDSTMKRIMTKLAATPTAFWFGDWNQNVQSDVSAVTTAAANANKTPVLVAYNIPDRDCNGYSSGGAPSAAAYQTWISNFAAGIGSRSAIVILEPDATAQITCLSSGDQSTRNQLLQTAITTLKVNPNTKVYLDAGNPSWVASGDMAQRLNNAGISKADGFSLNVSNFYSTSQNITYGQQVSALVGNKHFVIDTGRNGNGSSNGQWCNPSGMTLGNAPTNNTGNALVDYYLWVKVPGESDGNCNGGPAAGVWWPAYAESLATNAGW
jgi:endoglucanase